MKDWKPTIVSMREPRTEESGIHYQWGDGCDAWNLVDSPGLSVKLEKMPPQTAEHEHLHERARQFFFVLKGTATFDTSGGLVDVTEQQGLEIPPGVRHRVRNNGKQDLEFILCSQPSTAGDRMNIDEGK